MRKLSRVTLAAVLLFGLSMTACDEETEDTPIVGQGSLTAKIDGDSFVVDAGKTNYLRNEFTASDFTSLTIQGRDKDERKISIIISTYTGPSTYDAENNSFTYQINGGPTYQDGNEDGQVIITSDDGTTVTGTFAFKATHPDNGTVIAITAGTFSIEPTLNEI